VVEDGGPERISQEPERSDEELPDSGESRRNGTWESITASRPCRKSEGLIVAMKRGNARGAKEPCHNVFSQEVRRSAWNNPLRIKRPSNPIRRRSNRK